MRLFELLGQGGPIVYVLEALSFVALVMGIERLIVFFGVQSTLSDLMGRDSEDIRTVAGYDATLVERWLGGLVRAAQGGTRAQFHSAFALLEDSLSARLSVVSLIAAVAPLLGVLGTVTGMIKAFMVVEQMGRDIDPAALAGGIWEALITTGVGLVVAVLALVIHQLLSSWLTGLVRTAEHVVLEHPGLFGEHLGTVHMGHEAEEELLQQNA